MGYNITWSKLYCMLSMKKLSCSNNVVLNTCNECVIMEKATLILVIIHKIINGFFKNMLEGTIVGLICPSSNTRWVLILKIPPHFHTNLI